MHHVTLAIVVIIMVVGLGIGILILLSSLTLNNLHMTVVAFTILNVTFGGLMLIMVLNDVCDEHRFESIESLKIQFISTRLLHSKYSDNIFCSIIPPAITVNVLFIVIQLHHTIYLLYTYHQTLYSLCDALAWVAVLGWIAVMLFDSQTISDREPRQHVHALGVVLLTIGLLALHYISIFGSTRVTRISSSFPHLHRIYKIVEVVYLIVSIVFFVLFLTGMLAAIVLEYFVFLIVVVLGLLNLTLQTVMVNKCMLNVGNTEKNQFKGLQVSHDDVAEMTLMWSIPLAITIAIAIEFTTSLHNAGNVF